jgi:hypothetical protein
MASTDARPVPIKNTAFRVTFPILDNDGDEVTGAAGLDSEVSKDGGTFADCTNEATEVATSSGVYYLDLTSSEMNADCVYVKVKTSTTDAKTTHLCFHPQESGDIKVDVQSWSGTNVASPDTAGYPKVTIKNGTGTGEIALSSGVAKADLTAILTYTLTQSSSATITNGFKKFFDVNTPTGTINSIPHAVAGAAGGLLIAGSNAATTFATLTSTGAFSINGTSNVAQTVDVQSRLPAALTGNSSSSSLGSSSSSSGNCFKEKAWLVEIRTEFAESTVQRFFGGRFRPGWLS